MHAYCVFLIFTFHCYLCFYYNYIGCCGFFLFQVFLFLLL